MQKLRRFFMGGMVRIRMTFLTLSVNWFGKKQRRLNARCVQRSCIPKKRKKGASLTDPMTMTRYLFVVIALNGLWQGQSDAYTNEEICEAIFNAEGGEKSAKPYGLIYSDCETRAECYKVCVTTIKVYRRRFAKLNRRENPDFIKYVSRTWAPLQAGNDPQGLNQYHEKNLRWFIKNPKQEE